MSAEGTDDQVVHLYQLEGHEYESKAKGLAENDCSNCYVMVCGDGRASGYPHFSSTFYHPWVFIQPTHSLYCKGFRHWLPKGILFHSPPFDQLALENIKDVPICNWDVGSHRIFNPHSVFAHPKSLLYVWQSIGLPYCIP